LVGWLGFNGILSTEIVAWKSLKCIGEANGVYKRNSFRMNIMEELFVK